VVQPAAPKLVGQQLVKNEKWQKRFCLAIVSFLLGGRNKKRYKEKEG